MPLLRKFSSVPIGWKVGGLSAIAVLSIGVLTATFHYGETKLNEANATFTKYARLQQLADEVKSGALQMRRREKDFLLRKDMKYAEKYAGEADKVEVALGKIAALSISADVSDNAKIMKKHIAEHHSHFDKVVADYQSLGLSEKEGLKGQLRGAVHAAETKLKDANLDALTVKMLMMRRHEKDFMLRGAEKYIGRIDKRRAEFDPLLAESSLPDADKADISKLMDSYQSGFKAYAALAMGLNEDTGKLSKIFADMAPEFAALFDAAAAGKATADTQLEQARAWTETVFNVTAAFSLLFAVALGWLIGRGITRPIRSLTATMNELASGNVEVDVSNTDNANEIGDMARAVEVFRTNAVHTAELEADQSARAERAEQEKRAMMEGLAEEFDRSIGAIVERVAETSAELSSTAKSMSDVSETTSDRAVNAAAVSEQTTSNVQSVASAAEEMTASISEINQQVHRASNASKQAASDVDVTAKQMNALAGMADRIGEVISMISEIAEQTNLLALNATIESARVGEAGKGFAVVASEVKALASETAKATESISSLINEIQTETKTAVAAIGEIGKVIVDLEDTSGAIAAAMEEQGATTQSVAQNVAEAATGTREVSDSIAVVRDASDEARTATDQVSKSVEELAEQTDLMRTEVASFLQQIRAA